MCRDVPSSRRVSKAANPYPPARNGNMPAARESGRRADLVRFIEDPDYHGSESGVGPLEPAILQAHQRTTLCQGKNRGVPPVRVEFVSRQSNSQSERELEGREYTLR